MKKKTRIVAVKFARKNYEVLGVECDALKDYTKEESDVYYYKTFEVDFDLFRGISNLIIARKCDKINLLDEIKFLNKSFENFNKYFTRTINYLNSMYDK